MISKRLICIANCIEKNSVVFDVGTDHAQLPIFLLESGICKRAYAGDNKQGPLSHAEENIVKAGLKDKIVTVLADGIPDNIDADTIVIAGMGFHTIEHILDNCDIKKYKHIIVQSNNDLPLLRQYISNKGYLIEDEEIVQDDFYYEIVKFSAKKGYLLSDIECKYGPILLKKRSETFLQYLNYKLHKLVDVNKLANKQEYKLSIKEIEDILYNI